MLYWKTRDFEGFTSVLCTVALAMCIIPFIGVVIIPLGLLFLAGYEPTEERISNETNNR